MNSSTYYTVSSNVSLAISKAGFSKYASSLLHLFVAYCPFRNKTIEISYQEISQLLDFPKQRIYPAIKELNNSGFFLIQLTGKKNAKSIFVTNKFTLNEDKFAQTSQTCQKEQSQITDCHNIRTVTNSGLSQIADYSETIVTNNGLSDESLLIYKNKCDSFFVKGKCQHNL